jgi:hypothetical protein
MTMTIWYRAAVVGLMLCAAGTANADSCARGYRCTIDGRFETCTPDGGCDSGYVGDNARRPNDETTRERFPGYREPPASSEQQERQRRRYGYPRDYDY